jgi:hypothetical protein
LAFEAVQQPPRPQRLVGQGGVGEAIAVLGGEGVEVGFERRQPVRRLVPVLARTPVRVHVGNLATPQPEASTDTRLWIAS